MKLLCFSQIETCLFILHGFQLGYLQKLICQKSWQWWESRHSPNCLDSAC